MQKAHARFKSRAKHKPRHRHPAPRFVVGALALALGAFATARASESTAAATTRAPDSRPATESAAARLARWQPSFDEFAAADRAHAPAAGGVLFVGSSSIRLWDSLEQDFQALPVVIKRGFGGSRLSDCNDQVARLVLPYKPATVIVYAGDNDLADGATPQAVAATFVKFVESVRKALPATRIAYVSIKPSPLRSTLMAQMRETNALIAAYTATVDNVDYIDIYSKMLGADGQPRSELFGPDMLHLNRAGYALWRQEISARLGVIGGAATRTVAGGFPSMPGGDAAAPPASPRN